jgi:hypothetical protein
MEQVHQIDRGIIVQAAKSLQGKEKGIAPGFYVRWPVRLIRWGSALLLIFFLFTFGIHSGNSPIFSWERAKHFLRVKMPSMAFLPMGGPEESGPSNPAKERLKNPLEAREGGRLE